MNAIGIGAFFNLMNFGQMYGFHIVILPLFVVFLVALHLLQIRIRGIVRPFAPTLKEEHEQEVLWRHARYTSSAAMGAAGPVDQRPLLSDQGRYYHGLNMMSYDLVREALIALAVVVVLVVALAGFFSSPDDPPLTLQQYAQSDPVGFVTTAMGELSGTGTIAQYGPPYTNGTASVQYLGPISLQELAGVTIPIDTAQVYVLQPLRIAAQTDPTVAAALQTFTHASATQQSAWENAYTTALSKATASTGQIIVPAGNHGPLPTMMDHLLTLGTSGALDGLLLRSGGFYQNDFTKPLLFLSEDALPAKAQQFHMFGSQWGMMAETGNYPGQAWLWLYTFWYQIPPYNTSSNGDALIWVTMAFLTALLVFFPYLPYLNRLPYYLGVHRLLWREYYRDVRTASRHPVGNAGSVT
jgi:hypothetical protein